jgi:hypothetical protein
MSSHLGFWSYGAQVSEPIFTGRRTARWMGSDRCMAKK